MAVFYFLKVLRRKYRERGHVGCVGCIASGGHYLASGGTDEIIKYTIMLPGHEIDALCI